MKKAEKKVVRKYVDVERLTLTKGVQASLLDYAKVRQDLDDFDGDRRGILECLLEAEKAVVLSVLRAVNRQRQ